MARLARALRIQSTSRLDGKMVGPGPRTSSTTDCWTGDYRTTGLQGLKGLHWHYTDKTADPFPISHGLKGASGLLVHLVAHFPMERYIFWYLSSYLFTTIPQWVPTQVYGMGCSLTRTCEAHMRQK